LYKKALGTRNRDGEFCRIGRWEFVQMTWRRGWRLEGMAKEGVLRAVRDNDKERAESVRTSSNKRAWHAHIAFLLIAPKGARRRRGKVAPLSSRECFNERVGALFTAVRAEHTNALVGLRLLRARRRRRHWPFPSPFAVGGKTLFRPLSFWLALSLAVSLACGECGDDEEESSGVRPV